MMKDARYGWSGDILIMLSSIEEVIRLFMTLDGKAIEVGGGGRIVIEVLPHISLLEKVRNSQLPGSSGSTM